MTRVQVIIVILALLASASAEPTPAVMLRSSVVVQGENLLLSDFLPPDAPEYLRAQAAQVTLGRTPRPGSVRVIERIELEHQLRPYEWSRRLSVPPRVTVTRLGYRLDPEPVSEAIESVLRSRGVQARFGQLDMSAAPTVEVPEPRLRVLDVRYDELRQRWNARIQVTNNPGADPFLVTVPEMETPGPHPRVASAVKPAPPPSRPLLRAGEHATLLLNDPGFRATIPVVCLEAGLPGVDIRVRDEISGRIYRAQVAANGEMTLLPQ
jgi:hypothetical protein